MLLLFLPLLPKLLQIWFSTVIQISAWHVEKFIRYYYDTTDDKVLDELTKKNAKYALVCFFGQLKHVEPGPEINETMNKYFDKEFAD